MTPPPPPQPQPLWVCLCLCPFLLAACGHPDRVTTPDPPPPPDAAAPTLDAPPPAKVLQLNATGELVDIEQSFVPGHVMIVDFWAEWCGACKVMEDKLMPLIADEPRILVRKVDVGDGDTPVAEHYDIGPLPHLRVYDTHGKLRYVLLNNNALETGEKALEVLREDLATPRPE